MAIPDSDAAAWVKTWKEASPRLAAIRASELRALRDADIAGFIRSMSDAFTAASVRGATEAASTWSGLVEQQRYFQRLAERPAK